MVGNIWLQLGHDLLEECTNVLERGRHENTNNFLGPQTCYLLFFVALDGVLVSKVCGETKTHELSKTQKLFLEIPPRDSSIKLIDLN